MALVSRACSQALFPHAALDATKSAKIYIVHVSDCYYLIYYHIDTNAGNYLHKTSEIDLTTN